jgi:hypothetical protein
MLTLTIQKADGSVRSMYFHLDAPPPILSKPRKILSFLSEAHHRSPLYGHGLGLATRPSAPAQSLTHTHTHHNRPQC